MKRLLACILVLVMAFSLFPVALADEIAPPEGLSKVYVASTGGDGNSGADPQSPVKTLPAAVGKLEGSTGTVVLMDEVVVEVGDTSHYKLADSGEVTFTGKDGEKDYPNAAIYIKQPKKTVHFHFTPVAVLEHLKLRTNSLAALRLYSSDALTIEESVTVVRDDATKALFVCGGYSQSAAETSRLTILGGAFDRIYAGNDSFKIGNASLVLGGTASSPDLIGGGNIPETKGGNGAIDITIQGGTYTNLKLPALASGWVNGDITVTLAGGSLGTFLSSGTSTGALNVILKGGALQSVGALSGFTSQALKLDHFTGQIPAGLLAKFDTVDLVNESQTTYPSSDLTTQTITVEAGSTLTLAGYTSKPVGVTFGGEGTITLAEPVYSDAEPVLLLPFDDATANDASDKGNNGTIHGSPVFGAGYDGGKALYLQNEFGVPAQQYVTFWSLKGADLTRSDFSVSFWYKSVNGGSDEWATAANQANVGAGLDFSGAKRGGLIFSNRDNADLTASGISMANMPQQAYLVAGLTDANSERYEKVGIVEPQDERWHQVTLVYDRSAAYTVYVDGAECAAVNISAAEGQALGSNFLALGADLQGQYGLGNAYIDDFAVYPIALSLTDVQADYRLGALKALIYEVEERVKSVGVEYADADIRAMKTFNAETKALAETLTVKDQNRAEEARLELKAAFDSFLLSSMDEARQTMLLLSDIHISTTSDTRSNNLRAVFSDLEELRENEGLVVDGVVNAGDFADTAKSSASDAAFEVMNEVLTGYDKTAQMLACMGNHEVNYIDPDQCFKTGGYRYLENVQAHIAADGEYGDGVLDDRMNYSYGMTIGDYHYLVLSTDEQEQTGNAKDAVAAGQDGNAVDPIRHGVIFEDDTLAWVDGMLKKYSEDGKPVFVVGHFPFIDSVPLSYYHEQRINDNSIGSQDKILREMFAKYDNLVYFCGHLHSSVAMSGPVAVATEAGDSFTEINLSSLKVNVRGYTGIPTTWLMFVYDTEIVLRARNFDTGEWLTAYDAVIPITKRSTDNSASTPPSNVKTETTTNPDGSKTVTKTNRATGAVTTTTTYPDGAVVKTDSKADGTVQSRVIVPEGKRSRVLLPTAENTATTVAVLVLPDGTERVLADSVPTKDGIKATVPQSGTIKIVTVNTEYTDVPEGRWDADSVAFISARGIFKGTGNGAFSPAAEVTRGTLMTILARLDGEPVSTGDTWWQEGLEWAKAQGITDGTAPDAAMTREEFVVMLWRYAGTPPAAGGLETFSDQSEAGAWAREALVWAVGRGLIKGRSGLLTPTGTVTRSEAAAILERFLLGR